MSNANSSCARHVCIPASHVEPAALLFRATLGRSPPARLQCVGSIQSHSDRGAAHDHTLVITLARALMLVDGQWHSVLELRQRRRLSVGAKPHSAASRGGGRKCISERMSPLCQCRRATAINSRGRSRVCTHAMHCARLLASVHVMNTGMHVNMERIDAHTHTHTYIGTSGDTIPYTHSVCIDCADDDRVPR